MHKLYELKDKLMDELEGYADNSKYSKEDVEAIKYMASAVDHLCNIMEDEDYSMAYDYGRGHRSYARKRDSMGRYSREGYSMAMDDLTSELKGLMKEAPDEKTRHEFQRFIDKIQTM